MNKQFDDTVRYIIAQLTGTADHAALCASICSKYRLKDSHSLENIYTPIVAFRMFHQDVVRDRNADHRDLNDMRDHIEKIRKSVAALLKPHRRNLLGGSLVAITADHGIFSAMHLVQALLAAADIKTATPVEPAQATLEAFVLPLCEFWWSCTGTVPDAEFEPSNGGAPVAGTAAAFVVECLEAAGWSYSYQRIADAIVEAIITISMWAAEDQQDDADE